MQDKFDREQDENIFCRLAGRILIDEAFTKFERHKSVTLREQSLKRIREQIKHIKRYTEPRNIKFVDQLTLDLVGDYIRHRQAEKTKRGHQKAAPSTINKELIALRSMMVMCWELKLIPEVPIRKFPLLKETVRKPETIGKYTSSELAKILEYFEKKNQAYRDYFLFYKNTGCRRDEIATVKAKHIHLEEGYIEIRNIKTESSGKDAWKIVPILEELRPVLEARLKNKTADDLLFVEHLGKSKNWFTRCMWYACRDCKVQYRKLHGLRHTFISVLSEKGIPVPVIQKIVGHRDLNTTVRYIHVDPVAALKNFKI